LATGADASARLILAVRPAGGPDDWLDATRHKDSFDLMVFQCCFRNRSALSCVSFEKRKTWKSWRGRTSFPLAVSYLFPCTVRFASKPAMLPAGNGFVSCFVALRFPFPRWGC
jgi:hypothetical protein